VTSTSASAWLSNNRRDGAGHEEVRAPGLR
jgi:hypothetical protein